MNSSSIMDLASIDSCTDWFHPRAKLSAGLGDHKLVYYVKDWNSSTTFFSIKL